jgi:membrane-associated two-gene conflict system component 1 (EACC1)
MLASSPSRRQDHSGVALLLFRNQEERPGDVPGVELTLALRGEDSAEESRSLLDWLRADDAPGTRISLERGTAGPGETGALDDVLRLVCDPTTVAAVAGAIGTWLTTRRRAVELHLSNGDQELTIDAGSPRDVRKITGDIQGLLEPPADQPAQPYRADRKE